MNSANQNSTLDTPPPTPPPKSKAQILTDVLSLATLFSTCVEAFNLIHPSKDSDLPQKVALVKLGLQQGRLLIFGDVVGISSPPATIATHMIPSHPGATNPDPNVPINFGVRDPRLDDPDINKKVRDALDEIAGRPAHLTREEMMEKYGMKNPKRFSPLEYPSLDTNRLAAFREKYGLLQDLVRQSGIRASIRRGMSMAIQRWTVRDVDKFEEFVRTVRIEVDGLIALLGVKEQVDRGMKSDIRAMGWHPDLSGPVVRSDWEKLRLIREACVQDYPEYIEQTDKALKYISEELKGTSLDHFRASLQLPTSPPPMDPKPDEKQNGEQAPNVPTTPKGKEKRPSIFSMFKSWGKGSKGDQDKSKNISSSNQKDPLRSLSADMSRKSEDDNTLEPARSKSLGAVPDDFMYNSLESTLKQTHTQETVQEDTSSDSPEPSMLVPVNTANSLIDRHDMYKGVGRVETKDIRARAHDLAS
ncbi:hypothetical protein P154DRAFT_350326 [Amniculicola lignicola CBS 123094]|uniref:Prion-inhibition and propagation HeLo domain-containing protein n=1 Tax=Amniculicola lignicola CBS 123094 TaxID=1392246 RepID=A0A6A5W0D4_9PLEO|nr:hypothetical protein P154DRAFT_350326 [Amniculicola lignicola CBS 123094]